MELYNAVIENKSFHDFNPLIFGHESCEAGYEFGYSSRNYYLIHYIVSGSGHLLVNNQTFDIHEGQIFIIKPGELTKYYSSHSDPWTYIWIGFNGEMADNFSKISTVIDLNTNVFNEMLTIKTMNSMREEFLAGKMFQLYSAIFQHVTTSKYTYAVKNYIDTNYMTFISVENIAETLNVNRRYLSRIFKRDIGLSIQEYLLQIRFLKATELLSKGFSVQDTANMVGYKDQFVFSKVYKKHTGSAPSKVKKEKNSIAD